jgi:hypothetical protein
MDPLLREDFESLLADHGGPCVSLFLPTVRAGVETRQGPIRLRGLLREAQERLLGHGLLPAEAGALLAPAKDLLENKEFWRHNADGVAIFCSADLFHAYHLPIHVKERAVVGRRFAIKPLLPLTSGDATFYILALSRNQVRLLEARERSVREVELQGVPRSLEEALGDQDETGSLQDEKTELLRFCRRVDTSLRPYLRGRTAPLVVAGAAPLPAIYRQASAYPYLADEEIAGNPEHLTLGELHDLAWHIVGPHFNEEKRMAEERFRELMGTGKASGNLAEVVPAARGGRVDVLFVAGDETDAANGPNATEEELLEAAACFTLRNGGTTYEVRSSEMPGGGPVAAVFRY